ncbi:MAG TPA: response regulator [Thiotrichaceae bacterium]|nr:response regulator [Thiotrichaceae bacterium]
MNAEMAKKILLIDDDDDLRNLLGIYLKMAGYEIFHANDGEDGKEKLSQVNPDLIILDMMMPVLDGMGFLKWLRQETKQDIPVLALTGRSKSDTRPIVSELGATDVVLKPCNPDELVKRATEILSA